MNSNPQHRDNDEQSLGDILGKFDYANQSQLPRELVEAMTADPEGHLAYQGMDLLQWVSVFFCGSESLRLYLRNMQECSDKDVVLRLYVYNRARFVYFDNAGQRIGDHLGIYEWFPADAQHQFKQEI